MADNKLYEATFYCSLLLHAPSERDAIKQVKALARRNHLKIQSGTSERLQVFRHRLNGKLRRGPRFSPIEKRLKAVLELTGND